MIEQRSGTGFRWYRFEGPEVDRPREVRVAVHSFCIYLRAGAYPDRSTRSFRRTQKFYCVNGPYEGEWKTEEAMQPHGYVRFNRSWKRAPDQGLGIRAGDVPMTTDFPLTSVELERVKEFKQRHEAKHGRCRSACGGRYSYTFSPTSIGTAVRISCAGACHKYRDVTEYESW